MNTEIRLRFAPSPTGGLHIGGIRTLVYNYLFARSKGGKLIVRIEDTDQKRFVEGAEAYIFDCARWLGISVDEGVSEGGAYGPYRQSERRAFYQAYIQELLEKGFAYYAFDTAEELEAMRLKGASVQYDVHTRLSMRNSLTLSAEEVQNLLRAQTPYVVRIKNAR